MCFFFNDTATTEIYTLSLHDALPIWRRWSDAHGALRHRLYAGGARYDRHCTQERSRDDRAVARSEEHTSELQSPCNLVCRLLLVKKNNSPQPFHWIVPG